MTREELRQAVLAAPDATAVVTPVPTPEWPAIDGQIYVRSLTLPERTKYLAEIRETVLHPEVQSSTNGKAASTAIDFAGVRLAVISMCDAEGSQLMEEGDIAALAKKSWAAMNRVVDASAELNGLSKQSMEKAKNASPSAVTSSSSNALH